MGRRRRSRKIPKVVIRDEGTVKDLIKNLKDQQKMSKKTGGSYFVPLMSDEGEVVAEIFIYLPGALKRRT